MSVLSPNLRGIALMTLSMAFLTAGDSVVKYYSGTYDRALMITVIGAGSALMFWLVSLRTGASLFDRRALGGAALVRSLAEIMAGYSMVYALAIVPITVITLVMQSLPFLVTLGAVLFLGERVGWRRWLAIGIGFAGVTLILRPGAAGFSPDWLFALVAAVALAFRDLASRAVPKELTTVQIAGWGGAAVFLMGLTMMIAGGKGLPALGVGDILPLAAMTVFLATGVYLVSAAMRVGDVGTVAPFRYTRLPMGLGVGMLVFGETIDGWMILGMGVIFASGLFIFLRERRG